MRLATHLLLLVALLLIAAGPPPQEDTPVQAAQRYLAAVLDQDYDTVPDLVCRDDRAAWDEDAFRARFDQIETLDFTADPGLLEYETVHAGDDWAQVRVTGDVLVYVAGLDTPLTLTPRDLRLDTIWPVVEDGAWQACSRPPARAFPNLEPDTVAWLFLDAVFGGDYATAQALVCEAQAAAYTEANYNALFKDFVEGTITISLAEARFEIVEQAEDRALVGMTGTVIMDLADRPGTLRVPAEQFNWGAVPLVFEEGWKICR